jgi:hypothetical protein
MKGGPSEPMPESWRRGSRSRGPSSRNRRKAGHHVAHVLEYAEFVERTLGDLSEHARHLRRHAARLRCRIKAERRDDLNR